MQNSPDDLTLEARFFLEPTSPAQRQYEALRAYFVERVSTEEVSRRFSYTPGSFRVLCHHFRREKPDFFREFKRGPRSQPKKGAVRELVLAMRKQSLSIYDIENTLKGKGLRSVARPSGRSCARRGPRDSRGAAMRNVGGAFSRRIARRASRHCGTIVSAPERPSQATDNEKSQPAAKKPYQKPAFRCERVSETMALACGKVGPTQSRRNLQPEELRAGSRRWIQ